MDHHRSVRNCLNKYTYRGIRPCSNLLTTGGIIVDATRTKAAATIAILLAGAVFGCFLTFGDDISAKQSQGVVIDFGGMDVRWAAADLDQYDTGTAVLEYACERNGFTLTMADGAVSEINGVSGDAARSWGYWGIRDGSLDWESIGPESDPGDYVVTSWAYCGPGDSPAVGVDALGNSIYGYPMARTAVSMAPAITEIFGALRATNLLVGVDMYSDYPDSVVYGKALGDIAVIGGYSNPGFELIVDCKADIVFGDASQYIHSETCRKLIDNGTPSVLLYDGVDIGTIMDNVFIVGQTTGYNMASASVIEDMRNALNDVVSQIWASPLADGDRVMITLSDDKAPWASGAATYADDAVKLVGGMNVLSSMDGWVQINSEIMTGSNPEVIIVISSKYHATQGDYDSMYGRLPSEWQSTDAYKDGRIYLLCDGAVNLGSRPSPRVIQLAELFGRIIQPDVFTDMEMPKFIGTDYADYLTYTKHNSYNN